MELTELKKEYKDCIVQALSLSLSPMRKRYSQQIEDLDRKVDQIQKKIDKMQNPPA